MFLIYNELSCTIICKMKIEEHIKYWVESADHDLDSAESLVAAGKYDWSLFIDEVNDFNLEVRYPEYRREFYKKCTNDFAEPYFVRIKEMFQWIKSHLK